MANSGITKDGLVTKDLAKLIEDMVTRANSTEYFGKEFPTDPSSVWYIQTGINAASLKDNWDLLQAVVSQGDVLSAEGVFLDYQATLLGLQRQRAFGSNGSLQFNGTSGTTIPNQFPVQDDQGRYVLSQAPIELNRTTCYQSKFKVQAVAATVDYSVQVESDPTYTYTSDATPTEEEIILGLKDAIDTGGSGFYTATTEDTDTTLVITYNTRNNVLTTTNSANLNITSIGSVVQGIAVDSGSLAFPAGTITKIVNNISGLDSVTNPVDFTVGREEETDEELRARIRIQQQNTGTATKPAMESSLGQVSGVKSVFVETNRTLVDDPATGVPAKQFETIIDGGDNQSIAETIWLTQPADGLSYGDITIIIKDKNGDDQAVKFSRPTVKYAWVRVTYSINSEEIFPSNGEQLIRDSVVETGNSMYIGEDFEPTKFYGNIYANVQGVYISDIEIAVTALPTDTPVYQTIRIPVSRAERLNFDTTRVPLTIV